VNKNNIIERSDAKVEVAAGVVQEAVGKVIGNEKMEAKGAAHQVVGAARGEVARAAEHLKGAVEQVSGAAKAKIGDILDKPKMEAEGKVVAWTGKARQAVSKP
jgi:uncharacterized protein YjbJ (UPF0337 family)